MVKWWASFTLLMGAMAWCAPTAGQARRMAREASRAPTPAPRRAITANFVRDPHILREAWDAVASIRFGVVDRSALLAEDLAHSNQLGRPMRIGVNLRVPAAPVSATVDGDWTVAANGTRLWSLKLESPDAVALRVHFSLFDLPEGARLVLRGSAETNAEVFRRSGPLRKGSFWTPAAYGDEVFLEYQDASGIAPAPVIEIDEVSHIYRDPDVAGGADSGDQVSVAGVVLPCHVDVNCFTVDPVARDSVGRMMFTVPGQGSFVCTGALLADVDDNTSAGYFLTANHCLSTQAAADSLTVYWFYQSSVCLGSVPSLSSRPKSLGAELLATSAASDFTFLRLRDDPSNGQGFAAWTTAGPPVDSTVVSIHHPAGSYKRYAEGPVTTDAPICGTLPLTDYIYNDWTPGRGVTENGSSGAPLFNADWEVVGQLFGACVFSDPGCNNPDDYNAVFGRLGVTYPSIESYLNTITPDDEYEDNDTLSEAAYIEPGVYNLRLVDFDDYFRITLAQSAEIGASVTFDPQDMDTELYLLDTDGVEIDGGPAVFGSANVFAAVVPGDYILRVVKAASWDGDYTLDLQTQLSVCDVPFGVDSEPAPVTKNRYISFVPGNNAGVNTAIRVTFALLNRGSTEEHGFPDFSSFEDTSMWVGPPEEYHDDLETPPDFLAARLRCTPYFTDWSATGLIHVYGPELLPMSTYDIDVLEEGCTPSNPGNYSEVLSVTTNRWGDVVAPYWPQSITQPSFGDIGAVVDRFRRRPSSISKLRAQLQPNVPDPGADITFLGISTVVDAFRASPYPFFGPEVCP